MSRESEIAAAFGPYQGAVAAWLQSFFPFQREWVTDFRKFAALVKCRQIGGSHSFGARATLLGALGESHVLVSRAETEAIDLLDKAARHARVLHDLGLPWARIVESNQSQIKLDSGAIIRATTSKAAGRGFSGHVTLDEFAYHDRPQDVWDAASAATTHGFSLRVLSTPNGVGDLYHQLCTELASERPKGPADWRLYKVTIDDAIAQGMAIDVDECWARARKDPRVFDQLYRCKFLDGDAQYIPSELLSRAMTEALPDPYAEEVVAGLDIGEKRDKTVLSVIRGGIVAYVERHDRTDDVLIARLISDAFKVHGASRCAVDGTGMGSFPANAARRQWGPRLEVVTFTAQVKEALASGLYQALTEGKLLIQSGAPWTRELLDDIASIRRIVTEAGNVRFDAPRTDKGHADSAWALMLAVHCASKPRAVAAYSDLSRLWQQKAKVRA